GADRRISMAGLCGSATSAVRWLYCCRRSGRASHGRRTRTWSCFCLLGEGFGEPAHSSAAYTRSLTHLARMPTVVSDGVGRGRQVGVCDQAVLDTDFVIFSLQPV